MRSALAEQLQQQSGNHSRGRHHGERRKADAEQIVRAIHDKGRISLRVFGSSMQPWVKPGDIALIRKADANSVRTGDIVLFLCDEHLTVHRVVEKKGALDRETIRTQGDSHAHDDGQVAREQILGRVVRIYRKGKRIDLEAPGHLALGLLISQASLYSKFWYPAVRFAAIATRPIRRIFAWFAPPGELVR